jgi:arylsulfatase A-like enzyme
MNLVTIIIDSLRADHVGINGNSWIKTPSMDALGRESVRFTRAFPESMPTVQVRKALHTGKRVFPYRNWTPYKPAPTPGWTPLNESDATMAEILQGKGYRTALMTDLYHIFRPGMNFIRGFDEWRFTRGQEFDAFRSGSWDAIDIEKYLTPKMDRNRITFAMSKPAGTKKTTSPRRSSNRRRGGWRKTIKSINFSSASILSIPTNPLILPSSTAIYMTPDTGAPR